MIEIVTPQDGWILQRLALTLVNGIENVVNVAKPSGEADLTYFMHYHMYRPVETKTVAYFTHQEIDGHPLKKRWSDVASVVDACVSMAPRYVHNLPRKKTRVIMPYVDERYQPRRLIVGVACQWAHGNQYRKGFDLIKQLHQLEYWLDVRLTNGEVPDEEMLAWYHGLDVYLVASRYEGAPIPALEAAACGLPVVVPDVGIMHELSKRYQRVYCYETGEFGDMIRALKEASPIIFSPSNKCYENFKSFFQRQRFVAEHQALFDDVLSN